ncbi:uncharacterized protein JCM15063_005842 [Sporobolomyces koalae]|uniref:uncharacterized protein n=1 Tax=Sporobolomyces koalae TaxID=500713 RepID=UPI00317EA0D4
MSAAYSGSSADTGNTTSPAGASNPAIGSGIPQETLSSKMGITMPADAQVKDTEREGDHVVSNQDTSGTAGAGGDFVHKETQGHDVSKGRLETNEEKEFREARGLDEPVSADRKSAVA